MHGTLPNSAQLTDLAAQIKAEFAKHLRKSRESVAHAIRAGELLIQAKRAVGHGEWEDWLRRNVGFSDRTARLYMQLADRVAKMSPAKRQRAADLSQRRVLEQIGRNERSVEHYSPPIIVEPGRRVLGGKIHLDPASCSLANRVVEARKFFSKRDDGLNQPWHGCVFMNPPFDSADAFVAKLLEEFGAGRVTAAVFVLPGGLSIDNRPRVPLWDHPDHVVCLPRERISSYGPGVRARAIHCVVGYLGADVAAFEREFKQFGPVYGQRLAWLRSPKSAGGARS
jgi:Protein of unknown function (DUF3102)